jgi:DNA-binding PadR family transcriptional regulator
MFGRNHFSTEHHSRMFEKGDLKYVVLDLLKDKPSHGYEIIRAMEERFMGFYTPSAGSIYPTLQLLEDLGYVKAVEQDGKKVYSITEEGKSFLTQRGETVERIKGHMRDWEGNSDNDDLRHAARDLMFTIYKISRHSQNMNKEKLGKIKDIIARATADIKALDI